MKIVHVAPPFLPIEDDLVYGGVERVVNSLRKKQAKMGHETYVIAPTDSSTKGLLPTVKSLGVGDIYSKHVPAADVRKNTYAKLKHVQDSLEYSKSMHESVFHIHDDYLLPFVGMLGAPHILTVHCDYDEFWQSDELPGIEKLSSHLVALSASHRKTLESHGFEIIDTINNGIEPKDFNFSADKDGYLLLLSVVAPHKGQKTAIDIAKGAGMDLIIAGNKGDEDYFNSLYHVIQYDVSKEHDKLLAYRMLPNDRGGKVVYAGAVNDAQKKPLFERAAAFLMPFYLDEPFPLVSIEALASGTPVIALDRGPAREIITDGRTGYVCRNEKQMIEAVRSLDNLDKEACRNDVERRFSLDLMAGRYEKLYKRVMEKPTAFHA